jgi:hypothetical protein
MKNKLFMAVAWSLMLEADKGLSSAVSDIEERLDNLNT